MSPEDIERARQEAMANENVDRHKMEQLELLHESEALVQRVEGLLKQAGKTLDKKDKSQIKADAAALKKLTAKCSPETITETQALDINAAKERLQISAEPLFNR